MSILLKTLGYITCALTTSYLTLTAMLHDPQKPYRGHLNIRKDNDMKNDDFTEFTNKKI